jgi:hypothetical protein
MVIKRSTAGKCVVKSPVPRCSRCGKRQHTSWYSYATCLFRKRLLWAQGDPPREGPAWACVSRCGHYTTYIATTVTVWPTEAAALSAKAGIDRFACGGTCTRNHSVLFLGASLAEVNRA